MALNTRRMERSKNLAGSSGGAFLKLKNGKNTIRVFSFAHEAVEADFTRGLYKKSDGIKVGEEFDEVERVCWQHFSEEGVDNCPRINCDTCASSDEYMASKDKSDQKLGKDMRASKRFYVNVVNLDEIDKGVQICPLPASVFNVILEYIMDPEYGEDVLGCKGRDFMIQRDTSLEPSKMYMVKLRDANRCEELDEDLQSKAIDLFQMTSLDAGYAPEASEKAPAPSKGKEKAAPTTKAKAKPDPEDDEDDAPTPLELKKEKEKAAAKSKDKAEDKALAQDNDFEDDKPTKANAKGRKEKREIPDFVEVGGQVSFTNPKGVTEVGEVKKINVDKEEIEVETDTSFWDLDYDDVSPVKKEKARNRK